MLRPPESSFSSRSRYSRLFGGPFSGHEETHLRELAARMKDVPKNRRGRPRRGDLAPSGFVYLGQLLDHDLTWDRTRLEHAGQPPEETANLHSPRLNLESLYGGGPTKSPELYEFSEPGAETFLLGKTRAMPKIPATRDDFCRRKGKPLLADARNDQHLIIAQLHVAFLQFHNRIVHVLKRGHLAGSAFANETIFETARRLVIWHYQWIVRNEFLEWFVLPEILADIKRAGPRFFRPSLGHGIPSLPVEFTQAAFRFGHSMVQPQYEINRWIGRVRLRDLIHGKLVGENGGAPANSAFPSRKSIIVTALRPANHPMVRTESCPRVFAAAPGVACQSKNFQARSGGEIENVPVMDPPMKANCL